MTVVPLEIKKEVVYRFLLSSLCDYNIQTCVLECEKNPEGMASMVEQNPFDVLMGAA